MSNSDRHALVAMPIIVAVPVAIIIAVMVVNANADPARAYADRNALSVGRDAQSDTGSRRKDTESKSTHGSCLLFYATSQRGTRLVVPETRNLAEGESARFQGCTRTGGLRRLNPSPPVDQLTFMAGVPIFR
jgi:hypothetical protein